MARAKLSEEEKKEHNKAYRVVNLEKEKTRHTAYYVANVDKVRATNAAYYAANVDKARATNASYYDANRDKVKARHTAYYVANVDKVKARMAAYYAANVDKVNAASAAWKIANSDKVKMLNAAYNIANSDKVKAAAAARKIANPGKAKAIAAARERRVRSQSITRECQKTLSPQARGWHKAENSRQAALRHLQSSDEHVDHVVPVLAPYVGIDGEKVRAVTGLHRVQNMRLVPARVNISKSNKLPREHLGEYWLADGTLPRGLDGLRGRCVGGETEPFCVLHLVENPPGDDPYWSYYQESL